MTGTISNGEVAGSFSYGSLGSQGWRIIQVVGDIPDPVLEAAGGAAVRLTREPGEHLLNLDPTTRPRRLAWTGSTRDPWRFLISTVHAGSDASNRMDNNFTHGLIVRRGHPGRHTTRPSQYWGSPDWAVPFGAEEIAAVDLAGVRVVAINPAGWNVGMLAKREGLLLHLGTIVGAIEGALRTGRPITIQARAVAEGALYLDAALSLVPPELLWDATFEVQSMAPAPSAGAGSPLIRVGVGPTDADPLPGVLRIGALAAERAGPVSCSTCGLLEETWASLVTAALADVESWAQANGDRARADEFARAMADAISTITRPDATTSIADAVWNALRQVDGPWRRTGSALDTCAARLPSSRHQPLASHADRRRTSSAHVTNPAALADHLTQPVGEIAGRALQGALGYLADTGPSVNASLTAKVLTDWARSPGAQAPERLTWPEDWWRVIGLHRILGNPDASAEAQCASFIVGALSPTRSGPTALALEDGPFRDGCVSRFLSAMLIAAAEGVPHIEGLDTISGPLWSQLLATEGLDRNWAEALTHPQLAERFLLSWVTGVGHPPTGGPDTPAAAMRLRLLDGTPVGAAIVRRAVEYLDGPSMMPMSRILERLESRAGQRSPSARVILEMQDMLAPAWQQPRRPALPNYGQQRAIPEQPMVANDYAEYPVPPDPSVHQPVDTAWDWSRPPGGDVTGPGGAEPGDPTETVGQFPHSEGVDPMWPPPDPGRVDEPYDQSRGGA